jgi:hypothetical protein
MFKNSVPTSQEVIHRKVNKYTEGHDVKTEKAEGRK